MSPRPDQAGGQIPLLAHYNNGTKTNFPTTRSDAATAAATKSRNFNRN